MNKPCKDLCCTSVLLVLIAFASVETLRAQRDPGPRPVGNQSISAAGPTDVNGKSLMTTPVLDTPSAARVAISLAGTLPRDAMDALIISQVMTLGMGTTGLGAGTVGPDGGLYTSQTQTGLPNNGYGSIAGGTAGSRRAGSGPSSSTSRNISTSA